MSPESWREETEWKAVSLYFSLSFSLSVCVCVCVCQCKCKCKQTGLLGSSSVYIYIYIYTACFQIYCSPAWAHNAPDNNDVVLSTVWRQRHRYIRSNSWLAVSGDDVTWSYMDQLHSYSQYCFAAMGKGSSTLLYVAQLFRVSAKLPTLNSMSTPKLSCGDNLWCTQCDH